VQSKISSLVHSICIPGSYAINSLSAIAPDADGTTPGLHKAFPKRICCWAKTQEYTFKQQLLNGIRQAMTNIHCQFYSLSPYSIDILI